MYNSASLPSQPIVQYHWYAVTGRLYLICESGFWVYKITNLGQHNATTVKHVEANTLLSAKINCMSIIDSLLIGSLQTSIVTRPLQIKKNKDKINLLYSGISKFDTGSRKSICKDGLNIISPAM